MDAIEGAAGHHCGDCSYTMTDEALQVFDNLVELEQSLNKDTKMALFHIAGYVTRNDPTPSEEELLELTTFYSLMYSGYTSHLDRGGLNIPSDKSVQWSFFCFMLFNAVKHSVCRKSLMNIFSMVNRHHEFGMNDKHSRVLSNILLNNFSKKSTPRSSKESQVKVLKLS